MTARSALGRLLQHEGLNFVLTNRIPRRALTRFMGWFSRIEQPVVRDVSIAVWRWFAEVELHDAKKDRFASLHDCFTRELKEGARPIDPDPGVLVSPCDAIVGACGRIEGVELIQAKGFSYTLEELLRDRELARVHRNGSYVTLRLTSGMYHRFHAPHDCRIQQVTHVPGDTWNVNPIALKRVDKLFCRNERAVLQARLLATGHAVTLVPVAAVLVAGIRLRFLELPSRRENHGPRVYRSNSTLRKGEEMGWFEHGSTILLFAPKGFALCPKVLNGAGIRAGEPLLKLP